MNRATVAKWMKDALPHKCFNCGETKHLTYHHIVPVIMGGNDVLSNIAVLCPVCHAKASMMKDGAIVGHGGLVSRGMENARKRGVKLGKPNANYDYVMYLIAKYSTQFNDVHDPNYEPHTEREIMKLAEVKPVCYSKCKRMLIDAMRLDVWPYDWPKPKTVKNRPMYEHCVIDMRGDTVGKG